MRKRTARAFTAATLRHLEWGLPEEEAFNAMKATPYIPGVGYIPPIGSPPSWTERFNWFARDIIRQLIKCVDAFEYH